VAVVGYAYIIRGGKNRQVYAEDLVTGGFFNHSRNPLYVGNLLILLGPAAHMERTAAYLVGVPFFLIGYSAIVAAEEAFLRRKFGAQYDAYAARVTALGEYVSRLRHVDARHGVQLATRHPQGIRQRPRTGSPERSF
jgi:protein-S-isoprenylcysteine O-methyltransferase Ste14